MSKPTKLLQDLHLQYAHLQLDMNDCIVQVRQMLAHYQNLHWLLQNNVDDLLSEGQAFADPAISTGLHYLDAFAPLQSRDRFDRSVARIFIYRDKLETMHAALEQLQRCGKHGKLYHQILYHQYFSDEPLTEPPLSARLHLEKSTFYMRKREALALFGLIYLGTCIPA